MRRRQAGQQCCVHSDRARSGHRRDRGVVTSIGLFMLQRGVATIDKVSDKLDTMRDQQFDTAGEIRALKATSSTQGQIIARP